MPIILPLPSDPFDLVLAGEQLRASVLDKPVSDIGSVLGGNLTPMGFSSLVQDEDACGPMNSFVESSILAVQRWKNGELQMRANAGVATPCGAWIWLDYTPLLTPLSWATNLWAISGVTKDGALTPLANCRVIAFDAGRIGIDSVEAAVGEAVSDGSGNYTLPVPLNTAYQLNAYKVGAPDLGGTTRNDVVPTAVG